ncbi:MAG: ribonuclease P protein subunit [Candidatus Aenigmarchaeota archaeon]|nr:ribonuclease P protein subunit [Candidatus Aenigmarchaeota archaeon]
MIKPSNITKHEIIGLKCEASLKGGASKIDGRVIDETRNTFVVQTKKGKKTLIKDKYNFVFKLPEKSVNVSGVVLVGRSRDRIKKKTDKW